MSQKIAVSLGTEEHDTETAVHHGGGGDDDSTKDNRVQAGVREVEAIARVWSKTTLYTAFFLIWTVYFVMQMQQAISAALVPFVTSAFQSHSLTPTVGIISSIVGGVCNLTVAKILDIFGRPHGYAASLVVSTVGLAMMAATRNVEMYAAAQVFWTVGSNSLLYTVGIFVADMTTLRNRALMTALAASPNMVTIWLGGPISTAFLGGPGWRWAFGAFAVVVPVLCLPFLGLVVFNLVKARRRKQGVRIAPEAATCRESTLWGTLIHYAREFDAVGLLLVTGGLALLLLPFNLYTYQPQGWRSELIICLLVFGVVLMVCFAAWEKFLAPVNFIPFRLLLDRNMVGSCLLGAVFFASYYCWFGFFSSFLQVVTGLSITEASYVAQINGVGGILSCIATGYFIRRTGRFKGIALYAALPVYTLFMGLMIYFRQPDTEVGYIILCQVLIALASGVFMTTPQIAAMCVASHQDIAAVVAIISMFSSIGGAVGNTVGGAIWQAVFPVRLAEYLPADQKGNLMSIYEDLNVQLSYPVGSATRAAIQKAYADAQEMMCVAGTAILVLGLLAVAMWRDIDVRKVDQVKGQVL